MGPREYFSDGLFNHRLGYFYVCFERVFLVRCTNRKGIWMFRKVCYLYIFFEVD